MIRLALSLEGNLLFLLCFTLYLRAILSTSLRGAYIWRGNLREGFLHCEFGGLIFGGAYTWRGPFFGILRYVCNFKRDLCRNWSINGIRCLLDDSLL